MLKKIIEIFLELKWDCLFECFKLFMNFQNNLTDVGCHDGDVRLINWNGTRSYLTIYIFWVVYIRIGTSTISINYDYHYYIFNGG